MSKTQSYWRIQAFPCTHTSELRSLIYPQKAKIKYLHNDLIEDFKFPNRYYGFEISEYPKKSKPKDIYFLR